MSPHTYYDISDCIPYAVLYIPVKSYSFLIKRKIHVEALCEAMIAGGQSVNSQSLKPSSLPVLLHTPEVFM